MRASTISLLAAFAALSLACSSTTGSGCASGAPCSGVLFDSDGTCTDPGGTVCACMPSGVLGCAPDFVTSGCACSSACTTEEAVCQSCGGGGYRTCRCQGGVWTVTHGVACTPEGDGGADASAAPTDAGDASTG